MEKEVKGSLTSSLRPDVLLRAVTDLSNIRNLIPGIKDVVKTGQNSARVTVDTKLGAMSFEREFDLTVTEEAGSAVYFATSYGLDIEARISVEEIGGSTRMDYVIRLKGTSFSGNTVLRIVGEGLIREFTEQFSANLRKIQETGTSDS